MKLKKPKFRISPSHLREWHTCAYRLVECLKRDIPISSLPKNEYAIHHLLPEGLKFEKEQLEKMGEWKKTKESFQDLIMKRATIKHPVLKGTWRKAFGTVELIGIPEFITPYENQYFAGEMKNHKGVKETDRYQLAFYTWLLQKMKLNSLPFGYLVHKDGKEFLHVGEDIKKVQDIIKKIGMALYFGHNDMPKCHKCEFCEETMEEHDLTRLHDVGSTRKQQLNSAGITDLHELIKAKPEIEIEGMGVKKFKKIQLNAISYTTGKIFEIGDKIKFPEKDIAFFDIETSLNYENVWQIHCIINGKHHNFLAKSYATSEQKRIIKGFIKLLKQFENPILVMHSSTNFDFRVLLNVMNRLKLKSEAKHMSKLEYHDTCTLLKRSYLFPIQNYRLKDLGEFLGYKFKTDCKSGVLATLEFQDYARRKKKIPKKLVDYCVDDVECLIWILNHLRTNKFEKKPLKMQERARKKAGKLSPQVKKERVEIERMRLKGQTLDSIAKKYNRSIYWVNSRLEDRYTPLRTYKK